MRNWQELSNICNEARLTLSEYLVLYKIIGQGIKYKLFENFTEIGRNF